MTETRYCIICGETFEADDPEAVFCPVHGGNGPANSGQENKLNADPRPTVRKPIDAGKTRLEGKKTLDDDHQHKPQDFEPPAQDLADWTPGKVILDTYEIKEVLGEGGFGKVYRAYHKDWNMDLAIKRALNLDEANKQGFIDEAQHWIDLGLHPHIVSCFYVRNIDGFPHTFAELAEGGSLHDWIEGDQGNLYDGDNKTTLGCILDLAIQFAWGLGYAHEQGLVHGDVKPQNALMTPEGTLKVTDFGLARAGKDTTDDESGGLEFEAKPKKVIMSPKHCSPEQFAGQELSLKTDIWSWGVSVLEMFTGGVRWMGGQVAAFALESYLQHAGDEDDIPPMPEAIVELLRECFQESPQARPKDMLEIAEWLMAIYQQETGQLYLREKPKPADLKADSLNNKALSMLDLGKPEEAEALLQQALDEDGQYVAATYNLGLLRWRSGQADDIELLQQLKQIQQDQPEDVEVVGASGWVCMESGRFGEALSYFKNADRLGSDMTSADGIRLARPLAKRGAGACLRTFEGHTRGVTSVAISPDGRRALSRSKDKTLKLWDLAGGSCLRTIEVHMRGGKSVAFSPDGCMALSGSVGHTLKLWDLETETCLRTLEGHTSWVNSIAISPDGRLALSGSYDKTFKLWDLATGVCLRTFEGHSKSVNSVAFSPDGCMAFSGSDDKTLKMWDLHNGACLRTFEGHTDRVNSVAISPDGRWGLSGSEDYTLKLWDLETGVCLSTFKEHASFVSSVAISPDGCYALSGSYDSTLKLWDLHNGACLRTYEGHTAWVLSVAFSPDGCRALSGNEDHTLKLWDLAWVEENHVTAPLRYARGLAGTQAARQEKTHAEYLKQGRKLLAKGQIAEALEKLERARVVPGFERAPTTLALSASLGARAWVRGYKEGWLSQILTAHTKGVETVAISPDGCYALSGSYDKTLKLWDLAGGACLHTIEGHTHGVSSVAISPDGRWALSGSGATLKLWDLAGGECLRTFKGHTDGVESLALSPDGRRALSGGWDKTIKLWDLAGGTCLRTLKGHTDWLYSITISPDGRWALSGSRDKTLKLWDLACGECLRNFEGHTKWVMSVAISPDGRCALSGSWDKTLKLWDLEKGVCLRTFEGHTKGVTSVTISPDGRYALSGSRNTLKLWDLEKGVCLRSFVGHTGAVSAVTFSPDGRRALSGSLDRTIKLWNLEWEYEFPGWADWDEGARSYLETFLTLHTPYAGELPQNRKPTKEEIRLALTRQGKPTWTEKDFQGLLTELGQRGYGWLREEGVRKKLRELSG